MRAGTECVYGIVGLAKAMEVAYRDLSMHRKHIEQLKKHMINELKNKLSFIAFNGTSLDLNNSLYTVLSLSFPRQDYDDLLLFNLDLLGISCSGGSACSSGNISQSHVISQIKTLDGRVVRFSFSRYNSIEVIDFAVKQLMSLFS